MATRSCGAAAARVRARWSGIRAVLASARRFRGAGAARRSGLLWQSSHHGGHRFAANVLALPAGVQLGRVRPRRREVARLLRGHRIPLDLYRGRTLYPPHVQAAEIEIRRRLGLDRVDALGLLEDDGEHVSFAHTAGESTVAVQEHPGPVLARNCGAEPESDDHGLRACAGRSGSSTSRTRSWPRTRRAGAGTAHLAPVGVRAAPRRVRPVRPTRPG